MAGVLKGSGRQYIGAIVNFIDFYIIGLPLSIILGFKTSLQIYGLWLGILAALATQVR